MTSAQTKWFKFAEKQLLNFADRGGRGSENFKRLWIMKAPTVCLKSFGFVSSFGFLLGARAHSFEGHAAHSTPLDDYTIGTLSLS